MIGCRDDVLCLAAGSIEVCWLRREPNAGRRPLQRLLGRYLGVAADQVRLFDDVHGKPRLADPAHELCFSWSHTADVAVVAVARGNIELGVDVERLARRVHADALARRYFAPSEASLLARSRAVSRDARFLTMWTAKEAVLKALGRGLAFGIDRVVIGLDGERPVLQAVAGAAPEMQAWQLHSLTPPWPGLVAALAWRGAAREVRVAHVDSA